MAPMVPLNNGEVRVPTRGGNSEVVHRHLPRTIEQARSGRCWGQGVPRGRQARAAMGRGLLLLRPYALSPPAPLRTPPAVKLSRPLPACACHPAALQDSTDISFQHLMSETP